MLFICKLIFHKSHPTNIWNAKDLNEREMFNITSRTHVVLPWSQDKAMISSGLESLGYVRVHHLTELGLLCFTLALAYSLETISALTLLDKRVKDNGCLGPVKLSLVSKGHIPPVISVLSWIIVIVLLMRTIRMSRWLLPLFRKPCIVLRMLMS